jgi:hypothetical protein
MKIIFIIVIITFAGFFCKKINFTGSSKTSQTDTFIFGTDGGSLPGNYTYFKIENEKVYRNKAFAPGQETILFGSNQLPDDKYLLAKELKESFPGYLLSHPNQTFGCPNCADQGAIHIEMEHNGTFKSWDIDTDVSQQPAEIRLYIKRLLQIVSQI